MIRSRREFMARGAECGVGLLTFTVAGRARALTPAQAREAKLPLRTLDAASVRTLEALGETLLPGSARAGLAQYIDHQVSGDPADSMLMIKYLRVAPPYADFYLSGLHATRDAALRQYGKSIGELSLEQRDAFVRRLSAGALAGWTAPPPDQFYFVLRNDAVDVTYGTQDGFANLGVPYMAHIVPPTRWG